MNGDPYSGLIDMMRNEGAAFNPPSICLGEVLTAWPDISIKVGDLPIYKDDIKIADYLVGNYRRQINISGELQGKTNEVSGGSGYDSFASHSHEVSGNSNLIGSVEYTDTLQKGDEVVLLPLEDGNTYIVLARVV